MRPMRSNVPTWCFVLLIPALAATAPGQGRFTVENALKPGQMRIYDAVAVETQTRRTDARTRSITLKRKGTVTVLVIKTTGEDAAVCGVQQQWRIPEVLKYEADGRPLPAGTLVPVPPPSVQLTTEILGRAGSTEKFAGLPNAHFVLHMIARNAAQWPAEPVAVGDSWRRAVKWGSFRGQFFLRLERLEPVDGTSCLKIVATLTGAIVGANPEGFTLDSATVTMWMHPYRHVLVRRVSDVKGSYRPAGGTTAITDHRRVEWTHSRETQLAQARLTEADLILQGIGEHARYPKALDKYMRSIVNDHPDCPWRAYAEFIVDPPAGSKVPIGGAAKPTAPVADPRFRLKRSQVPRMVATLLDRWLEAADRNASSECARLAVAIATIATANRAALVEMLTAKSGSAREAAALALGAAREDLPDGYAALADDKSKEVRKNVALGIGMREPSRPQPKLLAKLIGDRSSSVRSKALWAAWRTTTRGGAGADVLVPLAMAKLSDHRVSVRQQAVRCVARFATQPAARAALRTRSKTEDDPLIQALIADALDRLGE